MSATFWIASIAALLFGYVTVGLLLARRWAERGWREKVGRGMSQKLAIANIRDDLFFDIIFWPIRLTIASIANLADNIAAWVHRPINERVAKATALVDEAREWDTAARQAELIPEADMARELAKRCRDQARDLLS